MRIRLTVARAGAECGEAAVVVTAPAGTVLAAVTGALVTESAAAGGGSTEGASGTPGAAGAGGGAADGPVAVFAGTRRLDPHRHVLGEPPLLDGAAISLFGPGPVPPTAVSTAPAVAAYASAPARLHVVAGPDAGGVHLLQGGKVHLGRSAEADVPLDDPDVSRLHCAVTVTEDGEVTVTDLGSTNGTSLDGRPVGEQPVPLRPGATLRLGETAVRLAEPHAPVDAPAQGAGWADETWQEPGAAPPPVLGGPATVPDGKGRLRLAGPTARTDGADQAVHGVEGDAPGGPVVGAVPRGGSPAPVPPGPMPPAGPMPPEAPAAGAAAERGAGPPLVPPPHTGQDFAYEAGSPFPGGGGTHGAGFAQPSEFTRPSESGRPAERSGATDGERPRQRGLGAWARRFTGGRTEREESPAARDTLPPPPPHAPAGAADPGDGVSPEPFPDPATVLLTALGPGPRLWERGPGHPEALTVRLGTAHRGGQTGGSVAVRLREAGALGLAGPRGRLSGLARSVVAQLAALHAPSTLEIVLLAADRARDLAARTAEWAWLGWLPHAVPAHGQDCRLLTAYDRDQAAARTAELSRRLDAAPARQPHPGPYTLLIVDGDPGSATLREAVRRLTAEGPAAGVHALCLAETPAASPASPLTATLEAAHAASPAFAACGTAALLSGAVATAVRMVHAPGTPQPEGSPGPIGTVDAVSAAWAERFARAMAPLREAEEARAAAADRPAVALPRSSRLLDELGLARATPAALLARWSEPGERAGVGDGLAGRASLVFGAGPRGPLEAELSSRQGHALITGPPGSGRTELLLSLAASLAAGERPGRLGLLLLDGAADPAREGLRLCVGLPHTEGHLASGDPARMREFAQSLSAELKRRAEVIGEGRTFEEYTAAVAGAQPPRVIAQRGRPAAEDAADLESDSSGGTLRLRTRSGGGSGEQQPAPEAPAPLPRLVVLVDDLETLVDPALGNPGRPASGSVVRALDAVAREGARLGVHLVAASSRPESTSGTELARVAALRAELTGPAEAASSGEGEDERVPGRGTLSAAAGSVGFQAGRVTGRIPRTATLRPTVVPLDWARAGDPPARRPVRELGNGPTDLALLTSAVERAAQSLRG
ncbi:FHA domain-containing protein [Streptomyces sp. ODS28]|uniref:FHA domain-containing protein n=1 Tax=Streptomyces sp. ODS28 TaxID=3136688 RepID=UPI0031E72B6F